MIFVTVGTHYQGFERLIKKMDEIAAKINDEVIMQIGHTNYHPRNAKWFSFLEKENDILQLYKDSEIVVAHGGAGTLLTALILNKKLIIVPRLKRYKEHIDNQQFELARLLERNKQALCVYDINMLEEKIKNAKTLPIIQQQRKNDLVDFISKYIEEIN